MQKAAESALDGYTGAIVILDPSTGAVLAKASSPTYEYSDVSTMIQSGSSGGALLDRTTQVRYAPGSTFKTVTLAAALESGKATLSTTYSAPSSIDIGGASITNDDGESWSSLSLIDAYAYSANTVFAQVEPK
uniref:Transpeptidase n=1 Tax=uncultured Thermanaerovibrio sp. TaxID=860788 RepID=A0A060C5E3_9BACT|nr:transpeptidase [uncultured Thermanaerovibrio sp.]